ncbi:MAG: hypothetical protein U9P12_07625 [Verrucomicrobiota bacterium]|nr:hypothetical protein [Verrucomicrobiota bacterium]
MKKEIDGYLKNFTAGDDAATVEVSFPSSFSGFQGHFPEQPVLPGVCQIGAAVALAGRMCGTRQVLSEIINAKFVAMVVPDQLLLVRGTLADGLLRAGITSNGERVAEFKLRVEDA